MKRGLSRCRDCACQAMYIKVHDEPCMDCHATPGPGEVG